MKVRALRIDPDDSLHEVDLAEGKGDARAGLYRHTGSSRVQRFELTDSLDMWYDDEFLYRDQYSNLMAAFVARWFERPMDHVRGPVVIVQHDDDGETVGLDDQSFEVLTPAVVEAIGAVVLLRAILLEAMSSEDQGDDERSEE